jgi:hypothetical protein
MVLYFTRKPGAGQLYNITLPQRPSASFACAIPNE